MVKFSLCEKSDEKAEGGIQKFVWHSSFHCYFHFSLNYTLWIFNPPTPQQLLAEKCLSGFYGSKNIYMNIMTQGFHLEHCTVAIINFSIPIIC